VNRQSLSINRHKPLLGRRIVITRPRSQASAFARAIEDLGGEVVEFPTIEILPPESYDALDRAIKEIRSYHWVIFTSGNGVKYFWTRFQQIKGDLSDLKGARIAAIGPETAGAVTSIGLHLDLVPQEYRAEAILQELTPHEVSGKRILLPRAAEARAVLPQTLRDWGAEVDVVEAYRTVAADSDGVRLRALLLGNEVDVVTFTSSSTVTHFAQLFPGGDIAGLLAGATVACIGPITHKTAEEMGIRVDVIPRDYTTSGLTQAIVEYFKMQSAK
jgi:uroporphyrinogen III methyltransferase/synthase